MQTRLAAIGLIVTAGGGTWLATAPPPGEYYAMSQQDVAARLVSAPMPGELGKQMAGPGEFAPRVFKRGDGEVVWEFSFSRKPIARFTASLEPDGEGTRVSVDFAMADSELGKAAQQDLGEGREFLTGLLEIAMDEHVAATLENRMFNEDAFGKEMATYLLTNPVAAQKYARQMQAMQGSGEPAVVSRMKDAITDDAAWHGDVDRLDTSGFDPTPPKEGW